MYIVYICIYILYTVINVNHTSVMICGYLHTHYIQPARLIIVKYTLNTTLVNSLFKFNLICLNRFNVLNIIVRINMLT